MPNNLITHRHAWKLKRKRAAALALIIAAGCLLIHENKKKQRRWWVRPWLRDKNKGAIRLTNLEFHQDREQFKRFLRLTENSFDKLLNLVKPKIEKQDTTFREAISAKTKLIVTLRFLATGETYRSLMYTFRISESTISLFVPVVCKAIYEVLKPQYLQVNSKHNLATFFC